MKRLAIITTHPIQYYAPLFKILAQRKNIALKVFYTWGEEVLKNKYDPGFNKVVSWDIPLLEGYEYEFVKNTAKQKGSHHFKGIITPTLINDIKIYNPDAILVMGWHFDSHLKVLRYFKGKKTILFRGDSNLLDELPGFSIKKICRRIFLTWIYRYVDVALYVGSANKDYYLKHGLKNAQLIFAPHAIDNNRLTEQAGKNKESVVIKREQMGISFDSILFLFAGKFEAKKNPEILIDAFIKLNNKHNHLLLVGNGNQEEMLKAKVNQQSDEVKKRIHFMPFQNQSLMPDLYAMCDVFCLPSRGPGETWGLAINEAMACSKVVLVSDKCGCYKDLVKDNVNGFVVKSNDINDLCDKIEFINKNQSRLPDMGEQSLKIIQEWSYENVCVAIEKVV